jgi:glycosyltransferase involved in cell wall biosynthesis
MQIAMVSPNISPIHSVGGMIGGAETYVVNLSIELAKLNHSVTLITASRTAGEYHLNKNLEIKCFETNKIFSFNVHDPFSIHMIKALAADYYDIIHVHQLFTRFNIFSCLTSRIRKIPSFLTDHGGGSAFCAAVPSLCAKFPNFFIAVSNFSRQWLNYFAPSKKSFIAYGGVDTNIFYPNYSVDDLRQRLELEGYHVLLYVGKVAPYKGIEVLIRALRYLPSNSKLLIVGPILNQYYTTYLKKLAYEISPRRVLFTGFAGAQMLPKFYNLCDVFVLPSVYYDYLGHYHRFPELLGLVKFEAMACGKPVVVSNVGGLPEQIINGKHGYIVREGNEHELAKAIGNLLADDRLRKEMGRRGSELIQTRLTWHTIAENVIQFYKSS